MFPICSICLEPATVIVSRVRVSSCHHEFCWDCLETWFRQQERYSSDTLTCPECRVVADKSDIVGVLGRMPGAGNSLSNDTDQDDDGLDTHDETEPDEFILAYMEAVEARQCPDCKLWVVKEDGCDAIMCRCGCRFCYCCGERGTHGGNRFYNNFADVEEDRDFDWNPEEESCAGEVWPLFDSGDWWDQWFPPIEEYEDDCYPVPLFYGILDDDQHDPRS